MNTRDAYEPGDTDRQTTTAGLVLLYAANHAQMSPAYPFRKERVVVGRDDGCDVVLRDEAASRRHAVFERESDGAFRLIDSGSHNGTLVDGVRVAASSLSHGMRIRLGDTLFMYAERHVDMYVPYALDGVVRGAPPDDVFEMTGGLQIRTLAREITRVAPTSLTCLILGETGTGKELVAKAMHRLAQRPGALQMINCAAIPAALFESELFGYKRGAFSGADRDKPGLVQAAQDGTLLLDEVGDLPMEAQAKLLRFLQSGEVLPVGAVRPEMVDVRILAATHRDLSERVKKGHFRADLLARLAEHELVIPALRERKQDIFMLASLFMRKYGKRPLELSFDAVDALLAHDWPLNVRELESCIKRATVLCDGKVITRKDFPPQLKSPGSGAAEAAAPAAGADVPFHRGAATETHLRGLLAEHDGNIAAVARVLGHRRMQVQRLMSKYGIAPTEYRRVSLKGSDER